MFSFGINLHKLHISDLNTIQKFQATIKPALYLHTFFPTMAAEYWKIANWKKLQCTIMIKCYLTIDHNCMTQAILYLESIQLGKFSDSLACDALHMSIV